MLYYAFSVGVALTEGAVTALTESKRTLCSQTSSLIIAFLVYGKMFAGCRIAVLAGDSYIASKAELKEA